MRAEPRQVAADGGIGQHDEPGSPLAGVGTDGVDAVEREGDVAVEVPCDGGDGQLRHLRAIRP
jgi:hypothetical protein